MFFESVVGLVCFWFFMTLYMKDHNLSFKKGLYHVAVENIDKFIQENLTIKDPDGKIPNDEDMVTIKNRIKSTLLLWKILAWVSIGAFVISTITSIYIYS